MDFAVLTRDEVQPYAPAFAAIGLEVIAMPVTHAAPPADPGALARLVQDTSYEVAIVASPRAAYALLKARGDGELPEIWVVGPSTKRVFDIARVEAHHPAGVGDGAGLATALIANRALAGKRILVPRAEEGRDDGIKLLRDAGAIVDDAIAYRTVPTPFDDARLTRGRELFATGAARVCAVFAPSQVTALARVVALAHVDCRFAAIGHTTAAALRDRGILEVAVAHKPTPEALAEALAESVIQGRWRVARPSGE